MCSVDETRNSRNKKILHLRSYDFDVVVKDEGFAFDLIYYRRKYYYCTEGKQDQLIITITTKHKRIETERRNSTSTTVCCERCMANFLSHIPQENQNFRLPTMESISALNVAFPIKLRAMLEETATEGLSHIVSWEMEGSAFRVHDPEEFMRQVMGRWFNQTKYKSFQRVSAVRALNM